VTDTEEYIEDAPQLYDGAAIPVQIVSAQEARFNQEVLDFDAWPTTLPGSGTIDFQFGEGWIYDVRRLTCASFTAGTVSVYKNGPTDANLLCVFTSAGSFFFGKGGLGLMRPHDHLFFVASGITGSVTPSMSGFKFRRDIFGEYVM
jgi:hypothetical protein